ncbi:MAG: hypothetical protein QUV02_02345 [Maricaulis sp.]|uniref:hypothetical protein n=1 Tax=Maricaulis sp. TaxID=1486257 RepID=UPI00260B72AF|nr:hypothetical protein [Maricaulis sp.]MDM7983262.1 hypothetical protein [Maricaulis sp.]
MKMIHFEEAPKLRFTALVEEWNNSEVVMKMADHLSGDVVRSSANELRYAGRRIMDFIACELDGGEDGDRQLYLLDDAIYCVRRAQRDAAAACILALRDTLHAALRSPRPTPDLKSEFRFLAELEDRITQAQRVRTERDQPYEPIGHDELRQIVEIVDKYRFEAAFAKQDDYWHLGNLNIHKYVGITVLVVSAAASITSLYVALGQ